MGSSNPMAATSDGNRLASTTDAAGKVTTYSYNANTNVLEWVKAPNDTDATKTTYTYDAMYRMASAAKDPSSGGLNLSANYTYTNDYLTGVQTPSTQYSFTYGAFGQRTSVKIGSRSLASYTYTGQNHLLSTLDYGNGDRVNYTYDSKNRVTKQTYEDSTYTSFLYDNCGLLAGITDSKTGLTTKYLNDLTGRSVGSIERSSNYSNATIYGYDENNRLNQRSDTIQDQTYLTSYTYDSENLVNTAYEVIPSQSAAPDCFFRYDFFDSYGRVSSRAFGRNSDVVLTNFIAYSSPGTSSTTSQISGYSMTGAGYSKYFGYTYDSNGNILTITDGTSYDYDKTNQLIRENNQAAGKTWTYTYDNAGNILSKTEYAYTTGTLGTALSTKSYTYGDSAWGDLLTSYNGTAITYDTIGNPLNDGTRTYTWERGRRLASLTTGGSTWNYTYNNDGLRIGSTNGSSTYTYYYSGSALRLMTKDNYRLSFVLASDGSPVTVTYQNTTTGAQDTYYYVPNPQGDIIALLDSSGTAVVEYTYDAWGNILTTTGSLASTLGVHNPFRYRGYIYDQETNLYYLQSRFYNPQTGRFINADAFTSTGQGFIGNNMFAYCLNNPAMFADNTGTRVCIPDVCISGKSNQAINGNDSADFPSKQIILKIKRTLDSLVYNLEFSAGIGQGLYAEFDILGFGASLGMYGNYATINYCDGTWYTGQELYSGASFVVFQWFEVGVAEYEFVQNGKVIDSTFWYGINDTKESWTLFSAACYPMAGGSISLGFDLNTFLFDINEIWGTE